MLYGLDKYDKLIKNVLDMCDENPTAELEFRLGVSRGGRFESTYHGALALKTDFETQNYIFKHQRYTNVIFNDGFRMRDGKTQKKTPLVALDLPYAPIAIRLSLANEVDVSNPPADAIPTITRDIERWSTVLREFNTVELSLSIVNGKDWEVELEFLEHPKNANQLIQPIEFILKRILPSRVNVLDTDEIQRITAKYNSTWSQFPQTGFLRKISNKPLNFTHEDVDLVRSRRYFVSHKLDGEKYTMITTDTGIYAISEVDAMWIADSTKSKLFTPFSFDCEWDPADLKLYVFDFQTADPDLKYDKRRAFCKTVCAQLKCDSVLLKTAESCSGATIVQCVKKTVKWMQKTYGEAAWQDRNDGIIFTPNDEPYILSGPKDRERRTLKYKFPDKISVDVRLRLRNTSAGEKAFACYAAGPHNKEIEVRSIHLRLFKDQPHYETADDGMIAEIALQNGVFWIMRFRPDKTEPNFISVVLDTLRDMRNPLPLDKLISGLSVKGGSADQLIPSVTSDQLEKARKYIQEDRSFFNPIYHRILEFAKSRKLKLSNPDCLAEPGKIPNVITLYSSNALRDSNDLSNVLFDHSPIIFLKTVIPYEEFDVSILNRHVVKFLAYPKVKHIKTDQIFQSIPVKINNTTLDNIDPKIELIEIYHQLYMPFPEKWDMALKLEDEIFRQVSKVTEGGAKRGIQERNEFTRKVRTALYDAMEYNDLGAILIGHWGYYELFPDSDPHNEKIQFITDLEPSTIQEKVENILRDVTPLKLNHKTEETHIPHDPHLRRTTYYFEFKGARIPLFDTFNSSTYEMVAWIGIGDKKIRVGNPYVLSRFFLIDRWILNVLHKGGLIPEDVYRNKSIALVDKVSELRGKKELTGGTDYIGVYKNFVIERRKLLKQEEKFRPYRPLEYKARFGSLRAM